MAFENLAERTVCRCGQPAGINGFCASCYQVGLLTNIRVQELKNIHNIIKICVSCGNKITNGLNKVKNMEHYVGLCTKCRRKKKDEIYLSYPEKSKKRSETLKKHYKLKRDRYTYSYGMRRGLESDIFINKSFHGSAGHHIDKKTVVYIPDWLHKAFYHNHSKSESLTEINKWADYWVQLEIAHKNETLKTKLLKFYEFYLNVVLEPENCI